MGWVKMGVLAVRLTGLVVYYAQPTLVVLFSIFLVPQTLSYYRLHLNTDQLTRTSVLQRPKHGYIL
jgi:hypothetical protein